MDIGFKTITGLILISDSNNNGLDIDIGLKIITSLISISDSER
jgi:hypothetical protein